MDQLRPMPQKFDISDTEPFLLNNNLRQEFFHGDGKLPFLCFILTYNCIQVSHNGVIMDESFYKLIEASIDDSDSMSSSFDAFDYCKTSTSIS